MTDLEITKLCAEAMGISPININGGEVVIGVTPNRYVYHPLHDDAQAMALVKRFGLTCSYMESTPEWMWHVYNNRQYDYKIADKSHHDLNRAICECVAKMQASK